MHHFDGAAGESWYVYGAPLLQALKLWSEKRNLERHFKVASIGLGLGYTEMLWALLKADLGRQAPQAKIFEFSLDSFEKVPSLQQSFQGWIAGINQPRSEFYDLAFQKLITPNTQLEIFSSLEEFKKHFQAEIKNETIHFYADLLLFSEIKTWNFICFDAFSKNTDQSLWNSDYLNCFLQSHAAKDCVFTTYAATTNLKRVLVKHGFMLIKRLGFSGKRECTLALRGDFTDDAAIFQTF